MLCDLQICAFFHHYNKHSIPLMSLEIVFERSPFEFLEIDEESAQGEC